MKTLTDSIRPLLVALLCSSLLAACAHNPVRSVQGVEPFAETPSVQPRLTAKPQHPRKSAEKPAAKPEPTAAGVTASRTATEFTWQGLGWGMSRDEVAATLRDDQRFVRLPQDNPNQLIFESVLPGRRAYVVIDFSRDELVQIVVALAEKFEDPDDYVAVWDQWTEELAARYGKGRYDAVASNHRDPRDRAQRGEAVAAGELTANVLWKVDDTRVGIVLTRSKEGDIVVATTYASPRIWRNSKSAP